MGGVQHNVYVSDKYFEEHHKKRLNEYDGKAGQVRISPLGAKHVEEEILKTRIGYKAINS